MPYILLVIGLCFAIFGLYRFFLKASPREIKALFLSIAGLAVGLGALFLAITGRLPAAIGILLALWPLALAWIRNRKPPHTNAAANINLTTREAYEVLGLDEGASEDAIREAHIRLMKKVHPDQEGSDWLAQKINAAKDLLLKR
jgi:hypothetical protein